MTLCECVTVMATGYRAQGHGGSRKCIYIHGFRAGYLLKNECHKRFFKAKTVYMKGVNPRATNHPHRGLETLSFPSTISTENVIVFFWSAQSVFMAQGKRSAHICLWATRQRKENKSRTNEVECGTPTKKKKKVLKGTKILILLKQVLLLNSFDKPKAQCLWMCLIILLLCRASVTMNVLSYQVG